MKSVDEIIQKAIAEGQFDNLKGQGQPLRLEENPFADPEWRLAYHVMQNGGFTLPWLEERRDIEAALESARLALQRAWVWREEALVAGQPPDFIEQEWQRACQAFLAQVEVLNQRIFKYNLETPSERFQLARLDAQRELARLTAA